MMTLIADLRNRLRGRMTCAQTLALLQQYLDGEISADQAHAVALHLDHCTMCDEEAHIYSEIKRSIAAAPGVADPEILARLERFGERVGNGEIVD